MLLVAVDNSLIDRLIANPDALKQFAFLRTAKLIFESRRNYQKERKGGACKRCESDGDVLRSTYSSIKKTIANLAPSAQESFKKLLGAEKISVSYRTGLKLNTVEF